METKVVVFNRPFTLEVLKVEDMEGYILTVEEMRVYETNKAAFLETLKKLQEKLEGLIKQLSEETGNEQ